MPTQTFSPVNMASITQRGFKAGSKDNHNDIHFFPDIEGG